MTALLYKPLSSNRFVEAMNSARLHTTWDLINPLHSSVLETPMNFNITVEEDTLLTVLLNWQESSTLGQIEEDHESKKVEEENQH